MSTSVSYGGTLTTLIAQGAADVLLTGEPSITFWRYKYKQHTNFAIESISQQFTGRISFGGSAQLTINRTGDLIYNQYVVIKLPGIRTVGGDDDQDIDYANTPDSNQYPVHPDHEVEADRPVTYGDTWCHWHEAIGQHLIKRVSIVIGGQVIDTLYSDFLFMWEELTGKAGKRLMEMIGKSQTFLQRIEASALDRILYVPLPWWFTTTTGNALPLISLQFHGVQVHVDFEELRNCVVVNSKKVTIQTTDQQSLTNASLDAWLETVYVYLDQDERQRFADGEFEQLIKQHQQFKTCTSSQCLRVQLNFNHPVLELIFAVRQKCMEDRNEYFNYSGSQGTDPIAQVGLNLNNLAKFAPRHGSWFRLVQPYQHHSNIPESYTYCFSFALNPEDDQPSGSANFSRIDNVELVLDLQDGLLCSSSNSATVVVYALSWNSLRFKSGLGGLMFAN